jgi:hypothetical protein
MGGRRPDAAYGLDGARDILLVFRLAMQAPNVRECQIPELVFVGHVYGISRQMREEVLFWFKNWKDAATGSTTSRFYHTTTTFVTFIWPQGTPYSKFWPCRSGLWDVA